MEINKIIEILISLEDLMVSDALLEKELEPTKENIGTAELSNKILEAHNYIMDRFGITTEDISNYEDLNRRLALVNNLKGINEDDGTTPYFSEEWVLKHILRSGETDHDSDVPTNPSMY